MRFIQNFIPPDKWKLPVLLMVGIMVGLGIYIFKISKAHSYLSDAPETCVNCHVMAPQYATWNHSSHREWATCNECHVPQNNVFNKYFFKAKDGLRHSTMFALRLEPQVFKIKDEGAEVVHLNCIRCHEYLLTDEKMAQKSRQFHHHRRDRKCWDCHRELPHGRVNSLSSVPNARVPVPKTPVPEWIRDFVE